jgi:addiction module HigA family antidote
MINGVSVFATMMAMLSMSRSLITIKELSLMNPSNKMRPIHPGEVLREEFLLPLGVSAHALAMELKVPAPRINDIVRERRSITPDTALRLARYFGSTPQFWLNLQTSYDLKIAERTAGSKIERDVHRRLVA